MVLTLKVGIIQVRNMHTKLCFAKFMGENIFNNTQVVKIIRGGSTLSCGIGRGFGKTDEYVLKHVELFKLICK